MPVAEKPLKVLIAEDNTATRLLLNALVEQLGYDTVSAKDGVDAVDKFAVEQPDIVLMDMLMPGMDGPQAMLKMRALAGKRWVPIIFVTADSTIESQVSLLATGADDYLVKPVHNDVLRAKLEVARRTVLMRREIEDASDRLREYRDQNEEEIGVVKEMMARMVRADLLSDPKLQHWILPAANLSGDIVAAARTPEGVLHAMVADGTGHGLAAALNVLPIAPIFYSMTEKGLDIGTIAAVMNRTIKQQLPTGRFVAATIVSVDYAARRIQVWNGGNPPLLVLDEGGGVIARFPPRNMALGILPDSLFISQLDEYRYCHPCQVFACSDGVVENLDNAGTTNGEAIITALLRCVPEDRRMEQLRALLAACDAERPAHDDMTLLFVRCDDEVPALAAPADTQVESAAMPEPIRRFELSLTPPELRELDVVSMLLDLLATIPAARRRRSELSVVLSELYSNALDHGVLGLKSELKEDRDGLERFAAKRAAALRRLNSGGITIRIEAAMRAGQPVISMMFRDSGAGFDFAAAGKDAQMSGGKPHGRGIALLRGMCKRVDYSGRGNEVSVDFALDAPLAAVARAA